MRRWLLAIALGLGLALGWAPERAAAHPLGNFTVNQYSRLEVGRTSIRLRYIVDMAEIPAFQERQAIDADGDGDVSSAEQAAYLERQVPALIGGLRLEQAGAPIAPRLVARELSFPAGQAGLPTLRLAIDLEGPLDPTSEPIEYHAGNFAERIGWREIVARAGEGMALRDSSVPEQDRSDELRAYPEDMLASPLDVRTARFSLAPGAVAFQPAAEATTRLSLARATDSFAALIASRELTPSLIAISLLLAFLLGAGHALAPGHGKTIVAAYLVGARGTARHAIVLGVTTTVTHTAGVFLLGFITLFVSRYILPEQLYPWLEALSGALVVGIGIALFRSRLAGILRRGAHPNHVHDHHHDHHHDDHDHTHHHDHDHSHDHGPHGHSHEPPGGDGQPITWRSLLALGVSGGLLPCPSALVVLLSAIALQRVAFGMLLIVAFSAGLAAVLTGIGLLLVYARRLFERVPARGRLISALPVASALIITVIGAGIALRGLAQTGLL